MATGSRKLRLTHLGAFPQCNKAAVEIHPGIVGSSTDSAISKTVDNRISMADYGLHGRIP